MDLVAALASIEDEPRRRSPLPLLVAALLIVAVGVPSDALSVVAVVAAAAVGSVVARRQHVRDLARGRRIGDAVSAYLQVEHDLVTVGAVDVHHRGADLVALDADGAPRAVQVRWTPVAHLRRDAVVVPVAGPVEVRLSALAHA